MKTTLLLVFTFLGITWSTAQLGSVRDICATGRHRGDQASPERRIYKYDPVRLIVGDIAFSLEQRVGYRSSLELELGPTVDGLDRKFAGIADPYKMESEGKVGYFTSFAYRFYLLQQQQAFRMLYLSPKLYYHHGVSSYTFTPPAESDQGPLTGDGTRNRFQFLFNVGFQWRFGWNHYVDIYAGPGIGGSTTILPLYAWNQSTHSYSLVYEKRLSAQLVYNFGVKIGIGRHPLKAKN